MTNVTFDSKSLQDFQNDLIQKRKATVVFLIIFRKFKCSYHLWSKILRENIQINHMELSFG